jgi:DNA-binding winged helix-turn-helix (wHTH) protein
VQNSPRADTGSFDHVQRLGRFGNFEVNLEAETLWRNGSRVRIQLQPFQLLVSLLDRPGEIVTREELRRQLWARTEHSDLDRNLNTALRKLRIVLRDSPFRPRYAETVRGRGYRFLAPAERVQCGAVCPAEEPTGANPRRKGWRVVRLVLAAAVVVVTILGIGFCRHAQDQPRTTSRDSDRCPADRAYAVAACGASVLAQAEAWQS